MSWRRSIYSALLYGLLPVLFLRLLWRSRGNPAYRQRWRERLGILPPSFSPSSPVICLHAVSVGETMAARPLVERLLQAYPEHCLWISSTTPTGSDTVRRLFAGRVQHSYLPYDTPGAVQRFLTQLRPSLLLVMETELWPNLYAACAQQSIPLVVANARLSERSARGYARFAGLVQETLACIHTIAAREQQDAARFLALGAETGQVQVVGNIKFDLPPEMGLAEQGMVLRRQWGSRPVWVAASTHAGEEDLVLQAHQHLLGQFPELLLVLVPRHPERFAAVAGVCTQQGLSFVRRSQGGAVTAATRVLLGDSMGELRLWYAAADVAFIGGSLVDVGGHNPLEALDFSAPVITGAHIHNFADIYPALVAAGGAVVVDSPADLAHHLAIWLGDKDKRRAAGQSGKQFLQSQQGVVERLLGIISSVIKKS